MRRMVSVFLLFFLMISASAGCASPEKPPPAARSLLAAMQAAMESAAQPLPSGLLYSRTEASDAPTYLTETLFTALYGRAAEGLLEADKADDSPAPVGDAAMFLSVAPYPCELAVFRCSDMDAIPTLVSLCRGRLDTVARGFAGTDWESAANGSVTAEGCFVFFAIAEDPEAVMEGARAALKKMR